MRDYVLLLLAWALCGVLALLLDARWEERESLRIPHFIAVFLGPCAVVVVGIIHAMSRPPVDTWRDRYHTKHTTEAPHA